MLVMSGHKSQELSDRGGRDALRDESLQRIRQTLDQVGVSGDVDSVYFTNFVMQ